MKPEQPHSAELRVIADRVVWASEGAWRLLGRDEAGIIGSSLSELELSCGLYETHGDHPCDSKFVKRLVGKTLVVSCQSVADSNNRACRLHLLDASDPADMMHRIILAKQEVEEIFDSSPCFTFLCDQNFNIIRANRSLVRELKTTFPQLLGRQAGEILQPLGYEKLLPKALECLAGKLRATFELATGERVFLVELIPLESCQEPPRLLVRYMDITKERTMEEMLLHWDRLRHLGTLAAGIAHEVTTPISYISWNLERLLVHIKSAGEKLDPENPRDRELLSEVTEALDVVKESLEGTAELKKRLKDLRFLSGRGDNRMEELNVVDTIERAVTLVSGRLGEDVKVVRDFSEGAVVMGNGTKLCQLFVNLLNNALDSMKCAGVVSLGLRMDGRFAKITVTDDGEGIPAENLERIFEDFFTTKASKDGTGLGLALSRLIARAHGGELSAASAPGKGATFTLTLPLSL